MTKAAELKPHMLTYIAIGLLAAVGGILATPLAAGPSVLLAIVATILMLTKGRGTLQKLGQRTLHARNVLLIAFFGWFFAELLSTGINNQQWSNLDYPLRFMLGIGAFWIIRYAVIRRTEIFFYSIAASALAAAAISAYQHFMLGMGRSLGWTNNQIHFGNLSVLLCAYAVIVLVVMRDKVTVQMRFSLAVAIFLLLIATLLSASRSSWLGFTGLLVLIDWHRVNRTRLIASGLVFVSSVVVILMLIPELSSILRVAEAIQDVQKILNGGDYRSSIGDRLQMWKAALYMFWSAPMVGMGTGHYHAELANLVTSGAVDISVLQGGIAYNQAHSEMLDALATKGLVGFVAYLVLLILPFRLFRVLSETTIAEVKAFAWMGQATIIAFLMFGLTNATFKIQIYCAVYPLTIAMFAAIALNLSNVNVTVSEDVQDSNRQADHEQG